MSIDKGKHATAKRLAQAINSKTNLSYFEGKTLVELPRAQPTSDWLVREGQKLSAAAAVPVFAFLQPSLPRSDQADRTTDKAEVIPTPAETCSNIRIRPLKVPKPSQPWGSAGMQAETRVSSAREADRNMRRLIGL